MYKEILLCFKSFSIVYSCINEVHVEYLSFLFPFQSVLFSVPPFSNTHVICIKIILRPYSTPENVFLCFSQLESCFCRNQRGSLKYFYLVKIIEASANELFKSSLEVIVFPNWWMISLSKNSLKNGRIMRTDHSNPKYWNVLLV